MSHLVLDLFLFGMEKVTSHPRFVFYRMERVYGCVWLSVCTWLAPSQQIRFVPVWLCATILEPDPMDAKKDPWSQAERKWSNQPSQLSLPRLMLWGCTHRCTACTHACRTRGWGHHRPFSPRHLFQTSGLVLYMWLYYFFIRTGFKGVGWTKSGTY